MSDDRSRPNVLGPTVGIAFGIVVAGIAIGALIDGPIDGTSESTFYAMAGLFLGTGLAAAVLGGLAYGRALSGVRVRYSATRAQVFSAFVWLLVVAWSLFPGPASTCFADQGAPPVCSEDSLWAAPRTWAVAVWAILLVAVVVARTLKRSMEVGPPAERLNV